MTGWPPTNSRVIMNQSNQQIYQQNIQDWTSAVLESDDENPAGPRPTEKKKKFIIRKKKESKIPFKKTIIFPPKVSAEDCYCYKGDDDHYELPCKCEEKRNNEILGLLRVMMKRNPLPKKEIKYKNDTLLSCMDNTFMDM